jgi:hypothetical protein
VGWRKECRFVVDNLIAVELKAKSSLDREDFAKTFKYLELLNLEVGLLINFGAESLQYHRLNNKKFKELSTEEKSSSGEPLANGETNSSSPQQDVFRSYLELYDDINSNPDL